MAALEHVATRSRRRLAARLLVGRGPTCGLRLQRRLVSGEHAVLWWTGRSWKLRDLGSRNGTFLDGRRLGPGEGAELNPGSTLSFGDSADPWRLVDASPPEAEAVAEDGGVRAAEGGILALPSADEPEVVIYLDPAGRWVMEREEAGAPIADRATLSAGGRAWTLHLPDPMEETAEEAAEALVLAASVLHFSVSRDEGYVELSLRQGETALDLEPRAHHHLLLALARVWRAEADLPPAERGWIHLEDLAQRLKMDRRTVNVHICRARQQLGLAGVQGAAGLIVRRAGTGQLRLGCAGAEIRGME